MPHAITPHAPVSLRRFHMPIASCFSHDGGRENIPIQCQLPEISEVFVKGVRRENRGTLSAVRRATPF
jgi:hypothetical protein